LPMISLMLSSSNSGSMGRRNGRIRSKPIAEPRMEESPAAGRASAAVERTGP
jgi:hypothetical protein